MHLTTTFYSETKHQFDHLLYVNIKTDEILFETKLAHWSNTLLFFKQIMQFLKRKAIRKSLVDPSNSICYQFAVWNDGKIQPLKWFDLVLSDNVTISHDTAFSVTLIKKNQLKINCGKFPFLYWKRNLDAPKYIELNSKLIAYKYIRNQIKKCIMQTTMLKINKE